MRRGEWVRTPVVDDLSRMEMGFSRDIGTAPEEWQAAFIDGEHAQVRLPKLDPGGWSVWLKRGGVPTRVGSVTVEG